MRHRAQINGHSGLRPHVIFLLLGRSVLQHRLRRVLVLVMVLVLVPGAALIDAPRRVKRRVRGCRNQLMVGAVIVALVTPAATSLAVVMIFLLGLLAAPGLLLF